MVREGRYPVKNDKADDADDVRDVDRWAESDDVRGAAFSVVPSTSAVFGIGSDTVRRPGTLTPAVIKSIGGRSIPPIASSFPP